MTGVSVGRQVLVFLYVVAGVIAGVTVLSLWTGVPNIWPEGDEVTLFLGVTLLVLVVGVIALVDYLRWPVRRSRSAGVRIASVGVVAAAFVGGYMLGSRVTVQFDAVGPMDVVSSVIGPGDPTLSVAAAVLFACFGALLVWLGLRRGTQHS